MESFSQRRGLKPIRDKVQIDSMDDALRNRLWNILTIFYWSKVTRNSLGGFYLSNNRNIEMLCVRVWHLYFEQPVDDLPQRWPDVKFRLKNHFFGCQWNEVYDFIQFVANHFPGDSINSEFMKACNSELESQMSGYRFVGHRIAPITSGEEINEIETALERSPTTTEKHLSRAVDMLSDKKSPDFRNSMKESISAVEAVCKKITDKDKATLDQALKEIETKTELHPALKKAFSNLYGYTSDADGIRHALKDQTSLDLEDARFMLVSCSAFVNYLLAKASRANIKI